MTERFHPWITGTEHLGQSIVRFHFAGGVVRDVDLRSVLSTSEMEALEAVPDQVAAVRTTVGWPNGVQVSPEMLELIYAGFGERKGWPAVAETVASEGGPFAVPSLADMGVRTSGGRDPSVKVITSSGEPWRHEKIDHVVGNVRREADDLLLWWAGAHDELSQELEGERRRRLVRGGLVAIGMLRWSLDALEQFLQDAAWADAVVQADADVRALVADALRWNEVWVLHVAAAAAKVFDPLENPSGFCEELRARLSDPNATFDSLAD